MGLLNPQHPVVVIEAPKFQAWFQARPPVVLQNERRIPTSLGFRVEGLGFGLKGFGAPSHNI